LVWRSSHCVEQNKKKKDQLSVHWWLDLGREEELKIRMIFSSVSNL